MPNTRILIVDDHALFREGAARLLSTEEDIDVIGCCGSIDEALALLGGKAADVVLLDLNLRTERGFQFFKPARDAGFQGRVLVVAGVVSPFEAQRLMMSGAAGVFLKQNASTLLVSAIHAVARGESYMDEALQNGHDARENSLGIASAASPESLTTRERAVLSGICEGLSNKEIATKIHVSEATVKATLQQLFDKHGVRTRSQLVRIALEQFSGGSPNAVN